MENSKDLVEIDSTIHLASRLLKTPHYAKLGEHGMFAIIQKAKSIGMDVLDALNGSMFFVNGKVELSGHAMNALIRSKGHSIQKDPSSSPECCVLVGKRADNGDILVSSFSLTEARRAGLNTPVWSKYPEDMLFWRALSRLARQLFPDVIKGCYVQGEIQEDFTMREKPNREPIVLPPEHISEEQAKELLRVFEDVEDDFKGSVHRYLERNELNKDFSNLPPKIYESILSDAKRKRKVIEV